MLLGEQLIAFRDCSGRVGVMDHRCPHRCASLFLGRNEENGIRCVYHGWKYDAEGNCVDMPNVHRSAISRTGSRPRPIKTVERNGLVWVYMGERKKAPPLPQIEATLLPESRGARSLSCSASATWLQALEGDIDTSHFGFLHAGGVDPDDVPRGQPVPLHGGQPRARLSRRRHRMPARCTPPTARPRRARPTGVLPISCCRSGPRRRRASSPSTCTTAPGSRWTTTHTMFVSLMWRRHPPSVGAEQARPGDAGLRPRASTICRTRPTGTVAGGSTAARIERLADRPRGAGEGGNYTGIDGIHAQDQAVTESMGPITDHLFEASGAERPDDHGDPPAPVEGGAGLGQGRHGAARGRRSRRSCTRCGAAISSPRRGSAGARPMTARCAPRSARCKMAAE